MKGLIKRMGAALTAISLTAGSAGFMGINAFGAELAAAGWYNTIYAEWNETNAKSSNVKVEYKLAGESEYKALTGDDAEYLIRQTDENKARVDIPGLKAGTYDIRITTSDSKTLTAQAKAVDEDRSGYAHFKCTTGVGAYKDDGTPMDNAVILYVTEENKNTVELGTREGIANILSHMNDVGTPLIVRFVGTVETTAWELEKYEGGTYYIKETKGQPAGDGTYADTTNNGVPIDGLNTKFTVFYNASGTSNSINMTTIDGKEKIVTPKSTGSETNGRYKYQGTSSAGGEDTSLNMMDVKATNSAQFNNVTIEGIGTDSGAKNWGFNFVKGNGIEVKNMTFSSYPEDGCSFTTGSSHGWLHRCTFNKGANRCDLTSEKDKAEGDGSSDMNGCNYITVAYNTYNNTHKTSLNGGDIDTVQTNYTYHHNYYNMCDSRLPLVRYANLHSYNNYVYNNTGSSTTGISARASAWVFSEENCYDGVKYALETEVSKTKGSKAYGPGYIKSYNDIFENNAGIREAVDSKYADNVKKVSSRTENGPTSSENKHTDIVDFDTNPALFYYDSENKVSDVTYMISANEVAETVPKIAGALAENPQLVLDYGEMQKPQEQETSTKTVTDTIDVSEPETATEGTTTSETMHSGTVKFNTEPNGRYAIEDTDNWYTGTMNFRFKEQSSDKVVIRGSIEPSKDSSGWTLVQVHGKKADGSIGEVFGIRTDKTGNTSTNYKLRILEGTDLKDTGVDIKADTEAEYKFEIDFGKNEVSLTVGGKTTQPVKFSGISSVSSIKFVTAAADNKRNLTVSKPVVSVIRLAGDADGSGTVTAADATAVARHVKGTQVITDEAMLKKADFDGNSTVEEADAKAIAEFVAQNTDFGKTA